MGTAAFTDEQAFVLLDRIYMKTKRLPTYAQCKQNGYVGGTGRFNAIRYDWACDRCVPMNAKAEQKIYVPPDLKAAAAAEKFTSARGLPMPEAERSPKKARPLTPPFDLMTPAQQAVQLYHNSWRRIREAGA